MPWKKSRGKQKASEEGLTEVLLKIRISNSLVLTLRTLRKLQRDKSSTTLLYVHTQPFASTIPSRCKVLGETLAAFMEHHCCCSMIFPPTSCLFCIADIPPLFLAYMPLVCSKGLPKGFWYHENFWNEAAETQHGQCYKLKLLLCWHT